MWCLDQSKIFLYLTTASDFIAHWKHNESVTTAPPSSVIQFNMANNKLIIVNA